MSIETRKSIRKRSTRETSIELALTFSEKRPLRDEYRISTGLPFFDHMLLAMAYHGGFHLDLNARGDIDVDPHHVVEDTGIVLGEALLELASPGIARYGFSVIPMDDALSEAVIDVCKRPYLVYRAEYPQAYAGQFQLALVEEFFQALASNGRMNLHLHCRYGRNGHHMAESLFKAFGRALGAAYTLLGDESLSTKGML